MDIQTKRIYELSDPSDGTRVLVDGMWPRGVSKDKANIDLWLKEIAPSNRLRKWFSHDPDKWETFQNDYFQELENKPETVHILIKKIREGPVTLVYAAKDKNYNNAVALKNYLQSFTGNNGHFDRQRRKGPSTWVGFTIVNITCRPLFHHF
mgnify:CR=1 FL=1